jgi:hypothetical protein
MNKKRFAILMVIALILSSFTFAYANNNGGNSDNKEKTSNKKIHVHLQSGKEDISEVYVQINGEMIKLESSGNSGKYTAPKGTDLVSENLTEIIIVYTSNETATYTPAQESQQGQEGQGSINYRLNTTESNNEEAVSDDTDEGTGNTGDDTSDGTGNTGSDTGGNTGGNTDGNTGGDSDGTGGTDNTTNPSVSNDSETIITIELALEETPQGTPELESQEITSTEETPTDTEIEEEALDLEDEETPLAIPSTGVATPLLYGAGALISLLGLLKRR